MTEKEQESTYVPGVGDGHGEKLNPDYRQSAERPRYVLESHEDLIYHDLKVPELATEPEYCAFLDQTMVFNRAMRWLRPDQQTIICYSACQQLVLTGEEQVSRWFSDPVNLIEEHGDNTLFVKKSTSRYRDCLVLPSFQFEIERFSNAVLKVDSASTDWQLCLFVKGRSGAPLFCSDWQHGAGEVKFDIKKIVRQHGYQLHYSELHFALGLWNEQPTIEATIDFKLTLQPEEAIIPCLPVITTQKNVKQNGVPISAIIVDATGQQLSDNEVELNANINEKCFPLDEIDGIWLATIPDLEPGEYEITLTATGLVTVATNLMVRVTNGDFATYSDEQKSLKLQERCTGPLSGSFQGMVLFKDAGTPSETMVNGQQQWDSWDRSKNPGEHWHYWESLTATELAERFAYLQACGWNLLHLAQHWGIWEKLDAGGRIAPYGAEQLALYLRVAARYKLKLLQALTHYPYSQSGEYTKPYSRYIDHGFADEDWLNADSTFTQLFHQYLADFIRLFKQETALFAMSTSGEGDVKTGADRVNDTFDFITARDKNHLFLAEPIHCLYQLPAKLCQGWQGDFYGSRTYWVGEEFNPDIDLAIEYKIMQLGPVIMAEGSWPCQPLYAQRAGIKSTWSGTTAYRTRVRDTLYLGLIHRSPLIITWDEQHTENEHLIFNQIRQLVDWSQPFMKPPVAIIIDELNLLDEGITIYQANSNIPTKPKTEQKRVVLAQYEMALSGLGLEARYITDEVEITGDNSIQVVIDARKPFIQPQFKSLGGVLPDSLKNSVPLVVTGDYTASYLWAEDRRTFLVYMRNTTNYHEQQYSLGGKYHRLPQPATLNFKLQNLPQTSLNYYLYNLNDKQLIEQGIIATGNSVFKLPTSSDDYFMLLIPQQ